MRAKNNSAIVEALLNELDLTELQEKADNWALSRLRVVIQHELVGEIGEQIRRRVQESAFAIVREVVKSPEMADLLKSYATRMIVSYVQREAEKILRGRGEETESPQPGPNRSV